MPVIILETISSKTKYPTFSNRRDRIAIMVEILTETRTGLKKTRIMCKCNLSYKQLELYNKMLLEKKLLARKTDEKSREKFVTTTKGNNFVKNFQALQALMLEKIVHPFTQL